MERSRRPWCFFFFVVLVLVLTLARPVLQIELEDAEIQFSAYEEDQVFAPWPVRPKSYKVLLPRDGRGRRRRRSSEGIPGVADGGEFDLRVAIGEHQLYLNFTKVEDLTSPGLTISFTETTKVANRTRRPRAVAVGCIYEASDASSGAWAVVSTCDHQMFGLLELGDQSFQLEDMADRLREVYPHSASSSSSSSSSRLKRAAHMGGVYVLSAVDTKVGERFAPPVVPDDANNFIDVPFDVAPSASNMITNAGQEAAAVGGEGGGGGGGGGEEEGGGEGRIVKRDTRAKKSNSLKVELMVFLDKKFYKYVEKRFPRKDPSKEASRLVLVLIKAVDRIYSTATVDNRRIQVVLKGIEVLGSNGPNHRNGDIYNYLINFSKWQKQERRKKMSSDLSKAWDHALLLTGHDLWSEDPQDNSTVGLAYVGGMCSNSFSTTITEATSLAAAYIIAHEVGHSLGMDHDGSKSASSCSDVSDRHIMSPVMRSGAVTWSRCSKESLKKFIDEKGSCLENEYGTMQLNFLDEEAGQIYDANQQCHYMYGDKWSYDSATMDKRFRDICSTLWCRNGRTYRTPNAGALDGTPCGKNKVCQRGLCKATIGLGKSRRGKQYVKTTLRKNSATKGTSKGIGNTRKRKESVKKWKRKGKTKNKGNGDVKKKRKNKVIATNRTAKNKNKKKGGSEKRKRKKRRRGAVMKYETKTHYVTKRTLQYVKDKGWKIQVVRVRKDNQDENSNEEKKKKKNKKNKKNKKKKTKKKKKKNSKKKKNQKQKDVNPSSGKANANQGKVKGKKENERKLEKKKSTNKRPERRKLNTEIESRDVSKKRNEKKKLIKKLKKKKKKEQKGVKPSRKVNANKEKIKNKKESIKLEGKKGKKKKSERRKFDIENDSRNVNKKRKGISVLKKVKKKKIGKKTKNSKKKQEDIKASRKANANKKKRKDKKENIIKLVERKGTNKKPERRKPDTERESKNVKRKRRPKKKLKKRIVKEKKKKKQKKMKKIKKKKKKKKKKMKKKIELKVE